MIEKKDIDLSAAEIQYYQKQLIIPEFGLAAQLKLKNARVLLVGLGGLGSPCAQYLTSAGVGFLGLVDGDIIEEHNLQRQTLYSVDDLGKKKVELAKIRLSRLNPHIKIQTFPVHLDVSNAKHIIADFDVIVDGTDNFKTRYLVNDTCVRLDKVNVYASIFRWEGQVSVFNFPISDEIRSPNYRDLFPSPPASGTVPNCSEAGILGAVSGVLGSWQALETIKVITGQGKTLAGEMLVLDLKTMFTQRIKLKETTSYGPSTLEDLEYTEQQVCESSEEIQTVSAVTLHQWIQEAKVVLVDVRSAEEYIKYNLGGFHIPLFELETIQDEWRAKEKIVFICQSGKRSAEALIKMKKEESQKMYSLEGGLDLYKSIF